MHKHGRVHKARTKLQNDSILARTEDDDMNGDVDLILPEMGSITQRCPRCSPAALLHPFVRRMPTPDREHWMRIRIKWSSMALVNVCHGVVQHVSSSLACHDSELLGNVQGGHHSERAAGGSNYVRARHIYAFDSNFGAVEFKTRTGTYLPTYLVKLSGPGPNA